MYQLYISRLVYSGRKIFYEDGRAYDGEVNTHGDPHGKGRILILIFIILYGEKNGNYE